VDTIDVDNPDQDSMIAAIKEQFGADIEAKKKISFIADCVPEAG
jgi:hypothetical protein